MQQAAGIVSCKWRGIKDEFQFPAVTMSGVADIGGMQTPVAAGPGGAVKRIRAPNASAMTGSGTNTYLVFGGHEVAVIDPGPDHDDHFHRIMTEVGPSRRITKILITHPHADHTGLASRLAKNTGAEMIAHSGAEGATSERMRTLGGKFELGGGEGLDWDFMPDRQIGDGELIACDEWSFEAVLTPGHTANHICYAWQEAEVLFSGDHVMGWSTTLVSPPHGDMGDFMRSLERLRLRTDRMFLPGHGEPITDPISAVASQHSHRRERERQILHCLRSGLTGVVEIAARVYSGLPAHLAKAAERNVLAHLLDFVFCGKATTVGRDSSGRPRFRPSD